MARASKSATGLEEGTVAISRLAAGAAVVVCLWSTAHAIADDCKPDVSRIDKITKVEHEIWNQRVAGTSFGASFMGSTNMAVFIVVGRFGAVNAVNVEILKEEASGAKAAFDSSLRAVKGNQFFLGFKDGGEPVSFVATEVGNETKVRNDVMDFGKGKVVTSVVLSSVVSDETLGALREKLTTKQIDAIRVILVGDLRLEQTVDDKSGRRVMAKFLCFYQAMEKRGVNLQAGTSQPAPAQPAMTNDPARMAAVQGRYARKGKATDFIDLNADGTVALSQDGRSLRGSYVAHGDQIGITSPDLPGQVIKGRVSGNTIKDADGISWEKLTEEQRAAAPPTPPKQPETPSATVASIAGLYVMKGPGWTMDLKPDGTVVCKLSNDPARGCSGTYEVHGDVARLTLTFASKKSSLGLEIKPNALIGKTQIWEKQPEAVKQEASKAASAPVTIRLGMTPEQVEEAVGAKPQKVIELGSKKIYVYSDMKITFMEGKVSDVQ